MDKNYNFSFSHVKSESIYTGSFPDGSGVAASPSQEQAPHAHVNTSRDIPIFRPFEARSSNKEMDTMSMAFQDPEALRLDIDRRIDEALELADRVSLQDGSDGIDIPSFLRKEDHSLL